MSAYSYRIEYKPGSQNQCADCLSRLPAASTTRDSTKKMSMIQEMDMSMLPVSAEDIARAMKRDSTLAVALQQVHLGHWPVQPSDDLVPYYRRRMELVVVMAAYCGANESSFQNDCATSCWQNCTRVMWVCAV